MTTFHVAALWRYPVKTLAGEQLTTADIGPEGVVGDRLVWVCGPEAVRTSRRHHRLLGLKGTLNADSHPLINGHRWDSPEALALVQDAAGSDAWLEESDGLNRFDVLPLLVATDGAVAAFGRDVRRLEEGDADTDVLGGLVLSEAAHDGAREDRGFHRSACKRGHR